MTYLIFVSILNIIIKPLSLRFKISYRVRGCIPFNITNKNNKNKCEKIIKYENRVELSLRHVLLFCCVFGLQLWDAQNQTANVCVWPPLYRSRKIVATKGAGGKGLCLILSCHLWSCRCSFKFHTHHCSLALFFFSKNTWLVRNHYKSLLKTLCYRFRERHAYDRN